MTSYSLLFLPCSGHPHQDVHPISLPQGSQAFQAENYSHAVSVKHPSGPWADELAAVAAEY